MSTTLLGQMEASMKTLIEGMTTTSGYNFNWTTVNNADYAQCDLDGGHCAYIELDPEEINIDSDGGANANSYLNIDTFKITSFGRLSSESDNPVFDGNEDLNKQLDDLKELFGTYYNLNGEIGTIQYKRAVRIKEPAGDIFIPKKLESYWDVQYAQDRTSPLTVGY